MSAKYGHAVIAPQNSQRSHYDALETKFSLSIITAISGNATKRIIVDCDNKPAKDGYHRLGISRAKIAHVQVDGLTGLAKILRSVNKRQALVHGVPIGTRPGDVLNVVSGKHYRKQPNTITRSLQHIDYPDDVKLVMFDLDPDPLASIIFSDPADFMARIASFMPQFAGAGWLRSVSTSSAIKDKSTGEWLKPPDGMHIYALVRGDVARFREILKTRLWLNGLGFCKLATENRQTGVAAVLERAVADISVLSPERLDYVAGALIDSDAPFYQALPAPTIQPGNVVNLDDIPDLTETEIDEYRALLSAAKSAFDTERTRRVITRIRKEKPELTEDDAEQEAVERLRMADVKEITPDHLLYFDDDRAKHGIPAGQCGKRHDNKMLADPQEPDYGPGKAYFHWNNGNPYIVSLAHGVKTRYTIKDSGPVRFTGKLNLADFDDDLAKVAGCSKHAASSAIKPLIAHYAAGLLELFSPAEMADLIVKCRSDWTEADKKAIRGTADWIYQKRLNEAKQAITIDPSQLPENCRYERRSVTHLPPEQQREAAEAIVKSIFDEYMAMPEPRPILLLRGPHGVSKTDNLLVPMAKVLKRVFSVNPLQSLTSDSCRRLELDDYRMVTDEKNSGRVGSTVHSSHKFLSTIAKTQGFVCDEIRAINDAILDRDGLIAKAHRDGKGPAPQFVMDTIVSGLRNAPYAAAVDADMDTVTVSLLAKSIPEREHWVIDIDDYYHGITIDVGTTDQAKQRYLDCVTAGKNAFFGSSGAKQLDALQVLAEKIVPDRNILKIHDTGPTATTQTANVKAFCRDPNSEVTKYPDVLTSPAICSGLSITTLHFDECIFSYDSVPDGVSPNLFNQQMRRYRPMASAFLGIGGASYYNKITSRTQLLDNLDATARCAEVLSEEHGRIEIKPATLFDEAVVAAQARDNRLKNLGRSGLLYILASRGYVLRRSVDLPAPADAPKHAPCYQQSIDKECWKIARGDSTGLTQTAVKTAEVYTDGMHEVVSRKHDQTAEEKAAIEAYRIRKTLDIPPHDPIEDEHFKLWKDGELLKSLRYVRLLTMPMAKAVKADQYEQDLDITLSHRRFTAPLKDALTEIMKGLRIDTSTWRGDYTEDTARELWMRLSRSPLKPVIEHHGLARFDRKPKSFCRWAGDVLRRIGAKVSSTRLPGGSRKRLCVFDTEHWQMLLDIAGRSADKTEVTDFKESDVHFGGYSIETAEVDELRAELESAHPEIIITESGRSVPLSELIEDLVTDPESMRECSTDPALFMAYAAAYADSTHIHTTRAA